MTAVVEKTTASSVIAMLRRHYIRDEGVPAGIFAAEINAPGGGRRADLIWQGITRAAGSELVGHEVKVSRADVLVELADLTKSDPWQRFCDRWWLVVPHPTLIDGLDLPPSWGVMCPPTKARARSMTVVRDAPKLNPDEQTPALRALAARVHWELRDARHEASTNHDRAERLQDQNRALRDDAAVAGMGYAERTTHEMIARIIRELGGPWMGDDIGEPWSSGTVDVDAVIAALRDLQATHKARDDADRTRQDTVGVLRRLQDDIARTLGGESR